MLSCSLESWLLGWVVLWSHGSFLTHWFSSPVDQYTFIHSTAQQGVLVPELYRLFAFFASSGYVLHVSVFCVVDCSTNLADDALLSLQRVAPSSFQHAGFHSSRWQALAKHFGFLTHLYLSLTNALSTIFKKVSGRSHPLSAFWCSPTLASECCWCNVAVSTVNPASPSILIQCVLLLCCFFHFVTTRHSRFRFGTIIILFQLLTTDSWDMHLW